MAKIDEEKKEWELAQCRLVAAEVNKARKTDYKPQPSTKEPADAVLVSALDKHPPLPVQVVSIPLDFRHRDDKHSVAKIQKTLDALLSKHGLKHCMVGLILSGEAEMRGIKHSLVEELAEIILVEAAKGDAVTLRYEDILDLSPELAELIHDILISHHDEIPGLEIDIPAGSALPPDGRWIEEGILKKVKKYGGAEAVKDLMLVIGVAGFVDDEQVDAFQNSHRAEMLPFSEIWIVTPFHGVICLKPRKAA